MQLNLSFAALFVAFLTVACDSRNQNEPIAVANREPESKLLPNTEDRSGAPQLTMDPDGEKNASANMERAGQLNSLEKTLVLFKSTPAEFQSFKDDGGLDVNSNWNGYQVSSIEVEYKKGILSFMHIFVNSGANTATMNNLKKDLSKECGDTWKIQLDGNAYSSETQTTKCQIERSEKKQGFHVFMMGAGS